MSSLGAARHHVGHLVRRFAGSLSGRGPTDDDEAWAQSLLLPGEQALWTRMTPIDRSHSVLVARRFANLVPAGRDEMAAALLHDVGKVDSGLGTAMRVVATVVGPRTARMRRYHEHERIGLEMLTAAGSSAATLALAGGDHPLSAVLRAADDI
ncbi:MAG: hypothetical protein ABIQ39_00420 [Ilumatobacteraceae bacterium]